MIYTDRVHSLFNKINCLASGHCTSAEMMRIMKNVMIKNLKNGDMGAISKNMANYFIKAFNLTVGEELEYYEAGQVPFEELPEYVQIEVLDVLKAYDRVHVTFANGKFTVMAATFILDKYPFDFCSCGTYYAKDLYTEEERRQNFFESFGYYRNR